MRVSRVTGVVCACAAAVLLGCVDDGAEQESVSGAALASCVVSGANGGFANTVVEASSRVLVVQFRARPLQATMDGVIGVARGDVDAYDDFAASVRFFTNGRIEARDGSTYRADNVATYSAGDAFDVRFVIDLASHTYSVFVDGSRLASGYRFRPTQAQVPSLDRVATIVASATGQLETCDIFARAPEGVLAVRDGTWDVQPLAGNIAVLSDGARTLRIDANNAVVRSIGFGGQVAVDAAGNVYVARLADGVLEARSYTAAFAARWTARYQVSGGGEVLDTIVSTAGQLVLLVGTPLDDGYTPQLVVRLRASSGRFAALDVLPAGTTAIGLGAAQYASARATPEGVELATHRYGDPTGYRGRRIWSQPFTVTRMALAADGSFVIGGHLLGIVDFGDGPLEEVQTDDGRYDAFVAAFSATFATQFSDAAFTSIEGLATTGREIAVSYFVRTQLPYVNWAVYAPTGAVLRGRPEAFYASGFGKPAAIALARSGRVYLEASWFFAFPSDERWPILHVLAP